MGRIKIARFPFFLVLLLALGSPLATPTAQADPGWTWVSPHAGPTGEPIDGFYRRSEREGFRWVMAHVADPAGPVPGHWRPSAPTEDGWVFMEGWVEPDGAYNPGFWRQAEQEGHQWLDSRQGDRGERIHGHWIPLVHRASLVWVPGHVGRDGRWVLGFWRQAFVERFIWIDGYWCDGLWYQPYWLPLDDRTGFVWVFGHVLEVTWVMGFWRDHHRPGYIWVPAHWRYGVWNGGFWHVGGWTPGPGITHVHHADAGDQKGTLIRDAHKKILQPRYVAYLAQRRVASPTGEARGAAPSEGAERDPGAEAGDRDREDRRSGARGRRGQREDWARRPDPQKRHHRPAEGSETRGSGPSEEEDSGQAERDGERRRRPPRWFGRQGRSRDAGKRPVPARRRGTP
jgi:hypothetical protein